MMNKLPAASRKRRIKLQFSVRSVFLLMALIGVTLAAIRAWYVTRLEFLVDTHNALLDAGRLHEVRRNAEWAMWLYSRSPISEYLLHQCDALETIQRGEYIKDGFTCRGSSIFEEENDLTTNLR
jgi:hypothetical protein